MLTTLLAAASIAGTTTTVFAAGDGGFQQIRIPSVVRTNSGTLLAFAEGRADVKTDQEMNRIVLRRSTDEGKSWGDLQIVADPGKDCFNNPCAVVDRRNGRVLLMFQRYPNGLREAGGKLKPGVKGADIVSTLVTQSDDDGKTWSPLRDITGEVKRPTVATTVASGPGVGIQLQKGPHKGRLVFPMNQGPFYQWQIYAAYSDDGGQTWKYGQDAPGAMLVTANGQYRSQVNEVQCAEASDGSIIMISRQYAGRTCRRAAVSRDGGQTWSDIRELPELTDPSCMGSVVRLSDGRLLYSGPDASDRSRGTVWTSRDGGKTWPLKRLIEPREFAYSVLVPLSAGKVGCLYETDGYKKIVFADLGKM